MTVSGGSQTVDTTTGTEGTSAGTTVSDSDVEAGSDTEGPSSGGASTSSSSGGDTSSSTSGDGTTTSGDGTTTSGDGTTTGGDDTGGDPGDGEGLDMCCEAGCSGTLVQSHAGDVTVSYNGARISTQSGGTLLLWDADTLALVARLSGVEDEPKMLGDRMLYRSGGALRLIDTDDASEVGVMPATATYGLAPDGGYVWTADNAGLTVYEPDGGVRWAVAGAYAGLYARALADSLNVFDKDVAPATIQRFAAADGGVVTSAFVGDFPHWFADSARFWTMFNQTQTYRFYDEAGVLQFSGNGYPVYGWGTRFLLNQTVYDVSAPDVAIGQIWHAAIHRMGPYVASSATDGGSVSVTRLDQDPIKTELIGLAAGLYEPEMSISFFGDGWVAGGEKGYSRDHLGRKITRGAFFGVAGAPTGRLVFGHDGEVYVHELADDCTTTAYPPFTGGGAFRMSGDGETLVANTAVSLYPLDSPKPGSRFHRLPDGEVLAQSQLGLHSDFLSDHDISDEGGVWSRYWVNTDPPGHAHADSLPLGIKYTSAYSDVLPKVSPDGQHIVESDGITSHFDDWVGDKSRIYVTNLMTEDPIAEFDGIAHGFIDDEHILVGVYVDPDDTFAGMRIVDLNGLDVQDVPLLPDIRRFLRFGTGEILAYVAYPVAASAIFDPWTGEQLWLGPKNIRAELAGDDFVLLNLGDRIDVLRWR